MIDLNLPSFPVADRVVMIQMLRAGERMTFARMEGPGCIRRLWIGMGYKLLDNRKVMIRIYFDDAEVPHVEAPLGDFFGVMHGLPWYPVNTPAFSVNEKSGYTCHFPMPFARAARIELECDEGEHG